MATLGQPAAHPLFVMAAPLIAAAIDTGLLKLSVSVVTPERLGFPTPLISTPKLKTYHYLFLNVKT